MRTRAAGLVLALVTLAVLVAPAGSAQAFEKGFWGPARIGGESQFPTYRALGVTLYQTQLRWDRVAPTQPANPTDPNDPAYLWTPEMDDVMRLAKGSGMDVLLLVTQSPPWANGGQATPYAPDPKAYADFLTAASKRYPRVRHWMVWGEPNRGANFQPLPFRPVTEPTANPEQRGAARRYARMLDRSYGALKRVSKRNIVIGGNTFTAGDVRPAEWVRNMRLPNGKPPRLDYYGHNPFCLRPPNLRNPPGPYGTYDFSDLTRLQRVIDRHLVRGAKRKKGKRKHVRMFLSEWTIPTGPDRQFNFYTTPENQARFIKAGFKIARKLRVYGLGWTRLRDEQPKPDGAKRSLGGLEEADGTRKPGFAAFADG